MNDHGTQPPLISLRGVCKRYALPGRASSFAALHDFNIDIRRGECVAVMGPSGSGKTTLVNLLTGIDSPSSGSIAIDGQAIDRLTQSALTRWRGLHVGIVFQFFQLLPTLTVLENVMLPMDFCARSALAQRRPRAMALLQQLGITEQAHKLPADLSGGQQQRAAIARALANDPALLLADEPTGNLDSATAHEVMRLLAGLAREGKTVLVVSHEREFGAYFTRTLRLLDGRLVHDSAANGP
jgi:putative ABC transport system ATP-binding protein